MKACLLENFKSDPQKLHELHTRLLKFSLAVEDAEMEDVEPTADERTVLWAQIFLMGGCLCLVAVVKTGK